MIYTFLRVNCDVPPNVTVQLWVDLLTLNEYYINKHLTGIQAQATGYYRCESANTQCVLPGTHYSV